MALNDSTRQMLEVIQKQAALLEKQTSDLQRWHKLCTQLRELLDERDKRLAEMHEAAEKEMTFESMPVNKFIN